jgi:hypothetical protein
MAVVDSPVMATEFKQSILSRPTESYMDFKTLPPPSPIQPIVAMKLEEARVKMTEDKKVQTAHVENKNVQAQTDTTSPRVKATSNKNVQTKKYVSKSLTEPIVTERGSESKTEIRKTVTTEDKSTSPIVDLKSKITPPLSNGGLQSTVTTTTTTTSTTTTTMDGQITFGHAIVEFFKVSAELDESTSKCILTFLTSIVSS